MKKLQWFKAEEEIPDKAVFIKSELKISGYEKVYDDPQCDYTEYPIYTEEYLYEVPIFRRLPMRPPR